MVNLNLKSYGTYFFCQVYPIFTCVDPDPYSEYGSGTIKLLNTVQYGSGSTTLLPALNLPYYLRGCRLPARHLTHLHQLPKQTLLKLVNKAEGCGEHEQCDGSVFYGPGRELKNFQRLELDGF